MKPTVGPQFALGMGNSVGFDARMTGIALTIGMEYRDD